MRVTSPDQLHLTLHFLGLASADEVVKSLCDVEFDPFDLELHGLGHFDARDGNMILWVGVDVSPPLLRLHQSIGDRLSSIGIPLDKRPYSPHITLARGPSSILQPYLESIAVREHSLTIPTHRVTEYTLYSSELHSTGPIYSVEHCFAAGS